MSDVWTKIRSTRPGVLAAVVGGIVVAALAVWFAASWLSTYRQADDVLAQASALRTAVDERQWEAVADRLPSVARSTADLAEATDSVPWRVLALVPFAGSSASAVHELAASLPRVLETAEPLVPFAERIVSGEVRTPSGAIDVVAMEEVAPLLKRFAAAMDSAAGRLALVDTGGVRPDVASAIDDFRQLAATSLPQITTAATLAEWVPSMLGADGQRDWLVLLQNPAEARGAGGFVGAYAVLSAVDGSITQASAGTSADLNETAIPYTQAPEDAQLLWGDLLGAWNTYNLSPHFPLAASLSAAGMKARGTPVAGVVAIDPATVAAMLEVTGPVTAGGETVTAANVEQFFTTDIYAAYPDAAERDRVSMEIVRAAMAAFLAEPWTPATLADALSGPASAGGVKVWSADADTQEWLAQTPVGGVVPAEAGSVIAIALNNAAGSKTDAFVQTEIDYAPGRCVTRPVQSSSLTVRLRNNAPAGLPAESYGRLDDPSAPAGSTNTLVHVYAPFDANFLRATIDGEAAPMNLGHERNRPVWWTYLPLDRGQERVIDVQFEEPMAMGVPPRVLPQSSVLDRIVRVTPKPEC